MILGGLALKKLLRVYEAADVLSLSRSKVYELIAAGEIAVIKIGKSARIEMSELERFIAKLRGEGGNEAR